jgi:CheY-like chemotaxis protein
MDYEMPRMNGPDAASTLRAEGVFTPIIVVTGNVLPEDQQYFLHCGANRVLRKPLSLPLLEKALVDIIMRKDEVSYIM